MPDNQFPEEPGEPSMPGTLEPASLPFNEVPLPLAKEEPPVGPQPAKPRGIAPIWHTLVLVFGILAFSIWGAVTQDSNPLVPSPPASAVHSANASSPHQGVDTGRLIRYALTGALELAIVAWVAFGMRLRKVPLRSLFGAWPRTINDITTEAAVASLFWISSMAILVVLALTWSAAETQIDKYHKAHEATQATPSQPNIPGAPGTQPKPEKSPEEKQADLIRKLMELAPANGIEIAAWGLLCLVVGFSEELVFRGYLQTQSLALLRRLPIGLIFTAAVFGLAHGYQGLRGVVLIGVYGLLFSCITWMRRNLFPGMLAHSWHDFFTGMMLALIRVSGMLDHRHLSH